MENKKSIVYFSSNISGEELEKIVEKLDFKPTGKVAIKVHSGEKGNQNFIKPEFYKELVNHYGGTIVECNTAYDGERNTSEKHTKLLEENGWSKLYNVDLLDKDEEKELEIPNGKKIKKNFVGANMFNYGSMIVVSHFKGHPMGGYGGALKNISIGLASSHGKAYIHGVGKPEDLWTADHDSFLESMADAASSVASHFKDKIVYVNIMKNMSVDCDCCAVAEDPCMKDIGILASTDPVALDKACLDLVYSSDDPGKDHLIERIESRNGIHTTLSAESLGVGTTNYELIKID